MNAASTPRADRHVALVKPSTPADDKAAHALQLLESMLWAFQGTTRSNWIVSASEKEADVIFVHAADCDDRVRQWQHNRKTVVVLETEPDPDAAHEYVLVYPFRAIQVMELLETLDLQLNASPTKFDLSTVANPGTPSDDPWSFLDELRMLREVQNGDVWLVGKIAAATVLWVRGDCSEYSADPATLQAIRLGEIQLTEVKLQRGVPLPAHRRARPAAELVWLDAASHYRIVRWPDFGAIRPQPSQLRATATLSNAALTVQELATRAHISLEEAARILNALSACRLLTTVEGATAAHTDIRKSVPEPAGGFKSFLRSLRKRLGLTESP
jgi:hypothetical protein